MDIHKQTAKEVFNVIDDGKVTEEMMDKARAINFGLLYGRGFNSCQLDYAINGDSDEEKKEDYFEGLDCFGFDDDGEY